MTNFGITGVLMVSNTIQKVAVINYLIKYSR
jgi:hypothetical protein